MTGRDLAREALDSLASHRLRAVLSTLGIVAGVGTVVAALAIASGARQQALVEIGALGIDNVLARSIAAEDARKEHPAPVLQLDDALVLSRRFPGSVVSALRSTHDAVAAGDRAVPALVAGVTPSWRSTSELAMATGRWIGDRDAEARVAVIGAGLARAVFRDADPVGQSVQAAGEWRTVVGVLAARGTAAAHGAIQSLDADRTLFVPSATLDVSLGAGDTGDAVDEIVLHLPPGDDVVRGAAIAASMLASRHEGETGSFEMIVPKELLRMRLHAERSTQILLVAVGALALVIGGVGILNIMVASVAERTAEIGVRRAVGARRGSVLAQFATEAALLGGAGGVAGVPIGALGAAGVAWIAGWPVALSGAAVIGALGLAFVVGLGAGIYPAWLAASVSPIEALRG